jgi:hypothetical protein
VSQLAVVIVALGMLGVIATALGVELRARQLQARRVLALPEIDRAPAGLSRLIPTQPRDVAAEVERGFEELRSYLARHSSR